MRELSRRKICLKCLVLRFDTLSLSATVAPGTEHRGGDRAGTLLNGGQSQGQDRQCNTERVMRGCTDLARRMV